MGSVITMAIGLFAGSWLIARLRGKSHAQSTSIGAIVAITFVILMAIIQGGPQ